MSQLNALNLGGHPNKKMLLTEDPASTTGSTPESPTSFAAESVSQVNLGIAAVGVIPAVVVRLRNPSRSTLFEPPIPPKPLGVLRS